MRRGGGGKDERRGEGRVRRGGGGMRRGGREGRASRGVGGKGEERRGRIVECQQ